MFYLKSKILIEVARNNNEDEKRPKDFFEDLEVFVKKSHLVIYLELLIIWRILETDGVPTT